MVCLTDSHCFSVELVVNCVTLAALNDALMSHVASLNAITTVYLETYLSHSSKKNSIKITKKIFSNA